ncbi:DinB family protein [Belnapia sp. T6]|uniref:DinB family protein n=1 Tax=Belnapia mucosa TaxID=2804532 RepID=A0ABS1UYQ5_9PROT|nr:DinB family protein [Belnapia mucosa]MBL6454593.1 DinB family protein [Belnapia mucosa]
MLAYYNQWANGRLYAAAGQIAPEALAEDRGAFFGSLLGTLNHLLVTDRLWMSRLDGESPRGTRLDEVLHHDFDDLHAARLVQDGRLVEYVYGLSEKRLAESLNYATSSGAPHSQPLHHVLAHLFNHQTHHRGQAHHLVGLALGRDKTPVLDLLAYQRSTAPVSGAVSGPISPPRLRPDDAEASAVEPPPTGHVVTDAYAEAADGAGEVRSTKQVPAPDSLGG